MSRETHGIRVRRHGGPEVLEWSPFELEPVRPGEVRLRHTAVGVNFVDIYFREGLYRPEGLPFVPGIEAVGVIEEVGSPGFGLSVGDRVGYPYALGAYAESRTIPADSLVTIPAGIEDGLAASLLAKGLTARYLVRRTYPVEAGDRVLVHAAAGGVGSLLCQWAHSLGAEVFGTAGSPEKLAIAEANGCDHAIDYEREDFVDAVLDLTGGEGVDVVYDSVGAATFDRSLACLKRFGLMVTFGNASGPVPPLDLYRLVDRGLYVTRPTLKNFVDRPETLRSGAADLFAALRRGQLRPTPPESLPLREAAAAHSRLESRRTTGATVLIP